MTSLATQLLTAGACYDRGEIFQVCALQPVECARNNQTFHSSLWLTSNNPIQATACSLQENIKNIPAMGRCDAESERFICTSHKTACRFSAAFQDYDSDCRVVHDYKTNSFFDKSYFPRCEVDSDVVGHDNLEDFCVWQFNECPSDKYDFDVADDFFANGKPNCQCDQVKVGACISSKSNEGYFCALSKEVCDTEDNYSYLKALQVESQLNITCKLCDTLPITDTQGTGGNMPSSPPMTPIQPATPRPSTRFTSSPTLLPSSSQLTGDLFLQNEGDLLVVNEKKSLTSGQIAGIVIGTLVVLLIIVGVYTESSLRLWRNEKEIVENAQDMNSLADPRDPEERSMTSIQ
mmetsp:Transcript_36917/g.42529  ORF Transcript_36917/g.42529 Transcript_36917/m.42529 type:complete len:348 (+) Transcript_36917:131-1174(+)|eukprot:CAMPEP_0170773778 /NCGR_PEP_ID=MMETSP0733-20121128/9569_1 /TAXON_ID=186038 /ORGANISM="Fragilariopsis kerguelensis, Strain L26-C5" /LENGTH=347 /DNA_ID=CAMNT_0011116217 /DNA_START=42 /DNA_END=1085 /DNA_ORIENTATION=+